MKITFWGVRGSIPVPGPKTVKYGGNSSCVELRTSNNELLIFDAGTGIRELGLKLMKEKNPIRATLLLSHAHMDHVNGFPFFGPAYIQTNHFDVIGCATTDKGLKHMLAAQMGDVYFPLEFDGLNASTTFNDQCSGSMKIGSVQVDVIGTNHPGDGISYKVIEKRKTAIYMTDNELKSEAKNARPFDAYVSFCKGADLLIHDTQYTPAEYERLTKGWGHSTTDDVGELAAKAGVKKLVIFHHDPERSDAGVEQMVKRVKARIKKCGGGNIPVIAAREKSTIVIQ